MNTLRVAPRTNRFKCDRRVSSKPPVLPEHNPPSVAACSRECPECRYALYPNTGRCTNQECPRHVREAGGALTGAELLREYASPPLHHGRRWGALVYDGKPVHRGEGSGVTHGVGGYVAYLGRYEIDLEGIRQSSGLLDWIFQIGGKTWATARVTKDLLNALDSIFHPQANFCSGGGNKIISDPAEFLRNRIASVGRTDGPLRDAA